MPNIEERSIDEMLGEMGDIISDARGDALKFDNGVKAPATRIRKSLFIIKDMAHKLRKEIMERKKSM